MKQFKYTTKFITIARCLIDKEKSEFLAQASLDDLKGLIPQEVVGSELLVPIAGNLFTANLANLNGDLVLGEDAINLYKKFLYAPLNSQHKQSEPIGCIIKTALSKFSPNYLLGVGSDLLTEEDVKKDLRSPFNCAIAGVLFRVANPDKVEEIADSSNPESNNYLYYSFSFEVGFSDFKIAIGSDDIRKAELIEDPKIIEELSSLLKSFGGKGENKEGKKIYRVLAGEMIAAGAGTVSRAAGTVKGLVSLTKEELESQENANENIQINDNKKENLEITSQMPIKSVNISVTNDSNKILSAKKENQRMKKLKSFAELKDLTQADVGEVCIASLRDVVENAINDASNKYADKIKDEEKAKTEALTKAQAAEDKTKELEAKVKEDEDKIKDIEIDCPDCEGMNGDEQYTCTICWQEGGSGKINVFQWLTENPELLTPKQ